MRIISTHIRNGCPASIVAYERVQAPRLVDVAATN